MHLFRAHVLIHGPGSLNTMERRLARHGPHFDAMRCFRHVATWAMRCDGLETTRSHDAMRGDFWDLFRPWDAMQLLGL